jgi:hypothetical protein
MVGGWWLVVAGCWLVVAAGYHIINIRYARQGGCGMYERARYYIDRF